MRAAAVAMHAQQPSAWQNPASPCMLQPWAAPSPCCAVLCCAALWQMAIQATELLAPQRQVLPWYLSVPKVCAAQALTQGKCPHPSTTPA
jgi:hypothetical protein